MFWSVGVSQKQGEHANFMQKSFRPEMKPKVRALGTNKSVGGQILQFQFPRLIFKPAKVLVRLLGPDQNTIYLVGLAAIAFYIAVFTRVPEYEPLKEKIVQWFVFTPTQKVHTRNFLDFL